MANVEITGKVVSDKMQKTVIVTTERQVRDERYGKQLKRTTRFMAHDEKEEAKVGDLVTIVQARPLSRNKRWVVTRVVERARL
ncbi:MAG: 30S ribosomal protein S17 [Acidobacteria bacterium]|jgi:small subunit ribosomal protein S17|nr:30S ribosomal protein S17 [Acidobacteriota bacterium]